MIISSIQAQQEVEKFEINLDGVNGYRVIEFSDKSTSEIFQNLNKWAQYNLRDANYSNFNSIEYEFLSYNVTIPRAVMEKHFLGKNYWNLNMDVQYRIKDNRLRIDILNLSIPGEGAATELGFCTFGSTCLFNKRGYRKVYLNSIDQIHEALNAFVKDVEFAINENPDFNDSDW